MSKGHLIVFEGIDGSGKSTAMRLAAELAAHEEYECFLTKEPTDGFYGKKARRILNRHEKATPYELQEAFVWDRLYHTPEMEKHLDLGRHVYCDRGKPSTSAYAMPEITPEEIDEMHRRIFAQGEKQLLLPSLIVYIDIPVSIAMKRMEAQNRVLDIHEKPKFLELVRSNYQALIARKMDTYAVIDGTNSPENVAAAAWDAIRPILAR